MMRRERERERPPIELRLKLGSKKKEFRGLIIKQRLVVYLGSVETVKSGQGGHQLGHVFPNGQLVTMVNFVDKDEKRSIFQDDLAGHYFQSNNNKRGGQSLRMDKR